MFVTPWRVHTRWQTTKRTNRGLLAGCVSRLTQLLLDRIVVNNTFSRHR